MSQICLYAALLCCLFGRCQSFESVVLDNACDGEEKRNFDSDKVMPLPPSLKPLPYLRLMGYNSQKFVLQCELIACPVATPIKYRWYHSKERYGKGKELEEKKLRSEKDERAMHHISGSDLYLDAINYYDWEERSGFYWCEAENDIGVATTNKVKVERSEFVERHPRHPDTEIKIGESVHLKLDRNRLSNEDLPVNMKYLLRFDDESYEILLKPNQVLLHRPGKHDRFVIGDDFGLYVLEAEKRDNLTYQPRQFAYTTSFVHIRLTIPSRLTVSSESFTGEQNGFFESFTDYIFVVGQLSYFTCIPKKVAEVTFKKNGMKIEGLTRDQNEDIFRTAYGLFFKEVKRSHAGVYTCHLEDDSATLTKTVKVFGTPEILCNKGDQFLMIELGKGANFECELPSSLVWKPQIFFNNKPMSPTKSRSDKSSWRVVMVKTVYNEVNVIKVKFDSPQTNEHDSGVFRISIALDDGPTKTEILETEGYKKEQFDKVQFNNFRLLPIENQVEMTIGISKFSSGEKPALTKRMDPNPFTNHSMF